MRDSLRFFARSLALVVLLCLDCTRRDPNACDMPPILSGEGLAKLDRYREEFDLIYLVEEKTLYSFESTEARPD